MAFLDDVGGALMGRNDRANKFAKADQLNMGLVEKNRYLQDESRAMQGEYANILRAQMAGHGPSVAERQYGIQQGQAIRAGMATAASGRGANAALAARTGGQIAGQGAMQGAQQAALGRRQEQLAAMGQFGSLAGQMRGQDLGLSMMDLEAQQANLAAKTAYMQAQTGAGTAQAQQKAQTVGGAVMALGSLVAGSDPDMKMPASDDELAWQRFGERAAAAMYPSSPAPAGLYPNLAPPAAPSVVAVPVAAPPAAAPAVQYPALVAAAPQATASYGPVQPLARDDVYGRQPPTRFEPARAEGVAPAHRQAVERRVADAQAPPMIRTATNQPGTVEMRQIRDPLSGEVKQQAIPGDVQNYENLIANYKAGVPTSIYEGGKSRSVDLPPAEDLPARSGSQAAAADAAARAAGGASPLAKALVMFGGGVKGESAGDLSDMLQKMDSDSQEIQGGKGVTLDPAKALAEKPDVPTDGEIAAPTAPTVGAAPAPAAAPVAPEQPSVFDAIGPGTLAPMPQEWAPPPPKGSDPNIKYHASGLVLKQPTYPSGLVLKNPVGSDPELKAPISGATPEQEERKRAQMALDHEMEFPRGVVPMKYKYKPEVIGKVPGATPGTKVGLDTNGLKESPEGRTVVHQDPNTGAEVVDVGGLTTLNTAKLAEMQDELDNLRAAVKGNVDTDKPIRGSADLDALKRVGTEAAAEMRAAMPKEAARLDAQEAARRKPATRPMPNADDEGAYQTAMFPKVARDAGGNLVNRQFREYPGKELIMKDGKPNQLLVPALAGGEYGGAPNLEPPMYITEMPADPQPADSAARKVRGYSDWFILPDNRDMESLPGHSLVGRTRDGRTMFRLPTFEEGVGIEAAPLRIKPGAKSVAGDVEGAPARMFEDPDNISDFVQGAGRAYKSAKVVAPHRASELIRQTAQLARTGRSAKALHAYLKQNFPDAAKQMSLSDIEHALSEQEL